MSAMGELATEADTINRLGIGGNFPPAEPTAFDRVEQTIRDLYGEAKNWLDGEPVNTAELAAGVEQLEVMLKRAIKEADAARTAEYKPLNDAKAKPQMTVKAAFDRYYVEVSDHVSSGDDELGFMGRLVDIGADKLLSEIGDSEVALAIAKRRGQKARGKDSRVSNATVNREFELLSRILKRAKKVWKVDVGEIDWTLHRLHEADERVRELSADEEGRLLGALRDDFRPIVRFAMISGLRLSNLIRLTWKQVDFDAGQISIKMKSKRPGGRAHTIPITPAMRALIANQRGNHPIYVFSYLCQKNRNERMGAKRAAGQRYPFSQNGWRKAWTDALKEAGIDGFRFHDLRHTAASRIVRATGNLKTAQKLLGHSTLAATTRYAHVGQSDVLNGLLEVELQRIGKVESSASSDVGRKQGGSDV